MFLHNVFQDFFLANCVSFCLPSGGLESGGCRKYISCPLKLFLLIKGKKKENRVDSSQTCVGHAQQNLKQQTGSTMTHSRAPQETSLWQTAVLTRLRQRGDRTGTLFCSVCHLFLQLPVLLWITVPQWITLTAICTTLTYGTWVQ